ncbi:nucleoside triphosphate pyrophosphohydrolase [Candidatus Contubernalis alkaliaceticus]|uniref:nucleoside triphosphate pyrophosphohydrolase n=1 Tax=Candidatus Contubernalis alkaliaceticus TaxID=338645 RepID=UPI001F4BD876|nr:nucleoside triphosphate pyrophosphohydrolase [Candidatus Contubernalis alkalaceticus]UNC90707.1 nucleoside triphosphate pyrophosphohydrolase [Candidatus Contubernalis alkalaceticus]
MKEKNTASEEVKNGNQAQSLSRLVDMMSRLRQPDGCPWDKKQTHQSLKPYLLEETFEVIHAIDQKDMDSLCEELGDLLLQVVFHSQLASETGSFHMGEVIEKICEKIIRRHPHVFGQERIEDAQGVSLKWSEIKRKEKKQKSLFSSPQGLPALKRAQKVQQQAAGVGFDWDKVDGAFDKVIEELKELDNVYKNGEKDKIEEEIGDLLFAAVNVSRMLEVDAELAMGSAVDKFLRRLNYMEREIKKKEKDFTEYKLEQLDRLWEKAKKHGL